MRPAFVALVVEAQASLRDGPAAIRERMRAVRDGFVALAGDASLTRADRALAWRCAARARECLRDPERAATAAPPVAACAAEAVARLRALDGADQWWPATATETLRQVRFASGACAAVGRDEMATEWAGIADEIEQEIKWRGLVRDGVGWVDGANSPLVQVWRLIRFGGVVRRGGRVSSNGTRNLKMYRKRAEARLKAARDLLWSDAVSAHADDPAVIAARGLYDDRMARLTAAPAWMPVDAKSLAMWRRELPEWALFPNERREWAAVRERLNGSAS